MPPANRFPDDTQTPADPATALTQVLPGCEWEVCALARGRLALQSGCTAEEAARTVYDTSRHTLKKSLELVKQMQKEGFLAVLTRRDRTGSAENPVTKLFPATVTEQRFVEAVDDLCDMCTGLTYSDEREGQHSHVDFGICQGAHEVPVNVKNAGTRFERAENLVGLDPDDCLPIPTYKAYGAIEGNPNLLYVIAVDFDLVQQLNELLPALFTDEEATVWQLLNSYKGSLVRKAEDQFIFSTVRKHWDKIKAATAATDFHVISARRAIRILHTKPKRTPGVGLRAWGTGASAEVNVHVSIKDETTPWQVVVDRIVSKGLEDIVLAVNRKRHEYVYDPEI